jgi:hypothetical protein
MKPRPRNDLFRIRTYPPVIFASLTGLLMGVSSIGNLAAATPMAWAASIFGWRACLWALAAATALTTLAIVAFGRRHVNLQSGFCGIGRWA